MIDYLNNIALRTTDLHLAFSGKKVFIAGRGFYATWFQCYFDHLKSHHGIAVECVSYSRRDNWDIAEVESYSDSNLRADFVINACGAASGGTSIDMLYDHGIGPVTLFRNMAIGARGLQISTGAINADTPYARAKRMAELGISLLPRDNAVQIVRPFATVGPGMNLDAHFAISTFIRQALIGGTVTVTNRPCHRSFVHITDLIVQMLHVLVNGDGKPYDVGSDDLITIERAARVISDDVVVADTCFPSNSAADSYAADLSRVKGHFNLGLDWSSEAAISDTYRWFQSHQS